MQDFLIALAVFGVAVAAMAIGAIIQKKPLKGTCGGLNNLADRFDGKAPCEICGGDPEKQPVDCSSRARAEDPLTAG